MLTPLGWGTAAGSVLLYAAGWWLGYPEPAVLAVAGLAAVGAAALWTLPRPKLEVGREIAPARVERGEPAVGVLHVTNRGRGVRGLSAEDAAGSTPVAVDIPRLRPGGGRTVTYRLPTSRRGEIPVGPLRLVRADPLRLARRVREYGAPRVLLVRPRTVRLALLPSGRAHHLEGPTSDRSPAGTATFHALREYVIGDELRHIHWKSSARTGTLMVRQLVDASLPTTTVVLEARPGSWPEPDDFELAVDAAASVAAGAASASFPVRILTGDGQVADTRGGPDDVEVLLDRLTSVQTREGPRSAVDAVRRVRPGGSLVVITPDAAEFGRIAAVRSRFDRIVVLRVRPREPAAAPPGVQIVDFTDLEGLAEAWRRLGSAR
ncbi:hypothetical protein GCM10010402_85710 [Actinomadura luteofluorescens]|uniref:DUF58 domain-containing protein n=1 Tax=Actinomadura luteofluorescens TaxID=46163 RepID=UPI0021645CEE|nr:DUF58 domain-containing protein [Actinomadura glauciflava]MCR3741930.1 Uncharacterized conserved protein, DUF58 family, contains vWF domain [Actinomadura glauciflava]